MRSIYDIPIVADGCCDCCKRNVGPIRVTQVPVYRKDGTIHKITEHWWCDWCKSGHKERGSEATVGCVALVCRTSTHEVNIASSNLATTTINAE